VTMQAQVARGLDTTGGLVAKIKAYLAVLIPVVVKSLVRAHGMAALLHVRGYGSGRRVKRPRRLTAPAVLSYAFGLMLLVASIISRGVLT
jgi:energy-coupling factor transporter transmembrane protein EcfT